MCPRGQGRPQGLHLCFVAYLRVKYYLHVYLKFFAYLRINFFFKILQFEKT